jgi:hypothetical protein
MWIKPLIILLLLVGCVSADFILTNQSVSNFFLIRLNASAGYNTTLQFRDTSLHYLELTPTYVVANSTRLSLWPSVPTSQVRVYIYSVEGNKTMNLTSGGSTFWVVGGFGNNNNISVDLDGVFNGTFVSNGSGYINFTSTSGGQYVFWSGVTTSSSSTSSSTTSSSSSSSLVTTTTAAPSGGGGGFAPSRQGGIYQFDLSLVSESFNSDSLTVLIKLVNLGTRADDIQVIYTLSDVNDQKMLSQEELLFVNANSQCAFIVCPHPMTFNIKNVCDGAHTLTTTLVDPVTGQVYATLTNDICVTPQQLIPGIPQDTLMNVCAPISLTLLLGALFGTYFYKKWRLH